MRDMITENIEIFYGTTPIMAQQTQNSKPNVQKTYTNQRTTVFIVPKNSACYHF
jgi:hypothetical protein